MLFLTFYYIIKLIRGDIMEKIVFQLPFYGKAGSISKIETVSKEESESVHHYLRYEYDIKGHEKQPQLVPKRQFNKLKENYFQDVKEWLACNQSKYLDRKSKVFTPKNTNLKKMIIDAIIYIGLAMSGFVLACLSISAIGMGLATGFGIAVFGISGTFGIMKATEAINYQTNEKNLSFCSQYKTFEQEVNQHNIEKDKAKKEKNKVTKYQGIILDKSNENTIKKTRVLEK